ncbi:MAG: hypothetical protein HY360_19255 [Verrucomicrobia bacterium]|nr:hypothetical protein [Verrucomicrobiota bacterium]
MRTSKKFSLTLDELLEKTTNVLVLCQPRHAVRAWNKQPDRICQVTRFPGGEVAIWSADFFFTRTALQSAWRIRSRILLHDGVMLVFQATKGRCDLN